MSWEPIESAPKDGSKVLVRSRWSEYAPCIASWHGHWVACTEYVEAQYEGVGSALHKHGELHEWHPLP